MKAKIHSVRYDKTSDVLYISTRPNRAAISEEGLPGVMWRYDASDGGIVGVTIVDFEHYWSSRISELTVDVAAHLAATKGEKMMDHDYHMLALLIANLVSYSFGFWLGSKCK